MNAHDFDRNAGQLLRLRIAEGSPNGVNYAPDSRYDEAKRCAVVGPLTIQIDKILRRHAKLWAQSMRDNPPQDSATGKAAWLAEMREADAEIKRYLAGPTFKSGACA
jgi:hypothetical protein